MSEHRRAPENARYTRIDTVTGRPVKLIADELGVITITTPEERRVADAFGLPVTRLPRMTAAEVTDTAKKSSKTKES